MLPCFENEKPYALYYFSAYYNCAARKQTNKKETETEKFKFSSSHQSNYSVIKFH